MREFKDYYTLLGVSPQASEKEIKQAFRRLANTFHPDKQRGEQPYPEGYYLAFSEAYRVLSDSQRRKRYDREFRLRGYFREDVLPEPAALLRELQEISRRAEAPELHQIDPEELRRFVNDFVTGPKAVLLLRHAGEDWTGRCLDELLSLLRALPDRFVPAVYADMGVLRGADKRFGSAMDELLKKARRNLAIRRLYPYLVLVVTLLLCLGMYFYAKA